MRFAILGTLVCAAQLPAQQITGVVRDSILTWPVTGAVVSLFDSSGHALSRGITNQRGEYRIASFEQGRSMRVMRIGYRPANVRWSPGTNVRNFSLIGIPPLLEPVNVHASTSCPKRKDAVAALSLLQQARAGLLATIVAREANPAAMLRIAYERVLDGNSERIKRQSVHLDAAGNATRSFVAVRTGTAFVDSGFVVHGDADVFYLGPDAEVLMDDGFASGYCFRLADPARDRPTQVGLAFEPANRKKGRVDIEGTLWIDTVARALRTIDFAYLGAGEPRGAIQPNGFTSFHDMANGAVFIDRWRIRMFDAIVDTVSAGRIRTSFFTRESGGEVAAGIWPDSTRWQAPLGELRAEIVDHDGHPVRNAVVRLDSTNYETTTNQGGVATFTNLLPGPYTATYHDTTLDRLHMALPTLLQFSAARDSIIQRRLVLANVRDFVRDSCLKPLPISEYGLASGADVVTHRANDTTIIVAVHVLTEDGRAVPNANVRISYAPKQDDQAATETVRTNAEGYHRSCFEFRQDKRFTVMAWRDGEDAIIMRSRTDWQRTTVEIRLPDAKK